jgi:hypothetical protein
MDRHQDTVLFSSGTQVVASGSVICYDSRNVVTIMIGPKGHRLAVTFIFNYGPGDARIELEPPPSEPTEIKLIIWNAPRNFPIVTSAPLELGVLVGSPLYLNFRAFGGPDTPPILDYTFYQGTITARDAAEALLKDRR